MINRFSKTHNPGEAGSKQRRSFGAMRPRFHAELRPDQTLELMVYGDIVDQFTISTLEAWDYPTDGLVSALNVKKALDDATAAKRILVRINSPGGDAFEGVAIHSLLVSQRKPLAVRVDGVAASAASIIAMAGPCEMSRGGMMMIHRAWSGCVGNSEDMRKASDTLDKVDQSIAAIYVQRTGKDLDEVMGLMADETWMTAEECLLHGFAEALFEAPAEGSAAAAAARGAKHAAKLRQRPSGAADDLECACSCDACQAGDCAECTNRDCDDANCKDCPMQGEARQSNLSLMKARQWEIDQRLRQAQRRVQ